MTPPMSSSASVAASASSANRRSGSASVGPTCSGLHVRSSTNARAAGMSSVCASSVVEVMDRDVVVAEQLRERVVFLAGLRGPQHVVEQQFVAVARRQPGQLEAGSMHDRLP